MLISVRLDVGASIASLFDLDGGYFLGLAIREIDGEGESALGPGSVFGYLDVVDGAVLVEIEVVDADAGVVEHSLERFACLGAFDEFANGLQIEAGGGVLPNGLLDRDVVVAAVGAAAAAIRATRHYEEKCEYA